MVEKKYIATRIYRELLSLGYSGGIAQIRRYIRKWKQDSKKAARVTTRVETDPGQQAQYDWKEWMLPVQEQSVKIYLHQVILSYSRYKDYTFLTEPKPKGKWNENLAKSLLMGISIMEEIVILFLWSWPSKRSGSNLFLDALPILSMKS